MEFWDTKWTLVMMRTRFLMSVVLFVSAACTSTALAEGTGRARQEGSGFKPYGFKYEVIGEDGGGHTREESSERPGRVVGSYTIFTRDGLERRVYYEADENGFRARVETNEPGVRTSSPADVSMVHTGGDGVRTATTNTRTRTSPSPMTQRGGTTASSQLPPGVILPPRYRPMPRGATQISSRIHKLDSSLDSAGKSRTPSKDGIATEAVARSHLLNIRPTQTAPTFVPVQAVHTARRPQYLAQSRRRPLNAASRVGSSGPLTFSRPNYPRQGQEQELKADWQLSRGVPVVQASPRRRAPQGSAHRGRPPLLHSVTQQSVELPHSSTSPKVVADLLRHAGDEYKNSFPGDQRNRFHPHALQAVGLTRAHDPDLYTDLGAHHRGAGRGTTRGDQHVDDTSQQYGDSASRVREPGSPEGLQDAVSVVTAGHGDVGHLTGDHPQRLDVVPTHLDHHGRRVGAAGSGSTFQPDVQTSVRRTQGYRPSNIDLPADDDDFSPFKPKPIEPGHPKTVFIRPTPPTSYDGYRFPRPGALTPEGHVPTGQPATPGHLPSGHLPLPNGQYSGLAAAQVYPNDVHSSAVQSPHSDHPHDGHDTDINAGDGSPVQSLDPHHGGAQQHQSYQATTDASKTEGSTPLAQPPFPGDAKFQYRTPSHPFGKNVRPLTHGGQHVDSPQDRGHDVFPLGTREPHHASNDLAVFGKFNHDTIPQMVERYAAPVPVRGTYEPPPGTPQGYIGNVFRQREKQILGVLSYGGLQPLLVNMEVTSNQQHVQERRQPGQGQQLKNPLQPQMDHLSSGEGHFKQELHPKEADDAFLYTAEKSSQTQNPTTYLHPYNSIPHNAGGDVNRRSLQPSSHGGPLVRAAGLNSPQDPHVRPKNSVNGGADFSGPNFKQYNDDDDDKYGTEFVHDLGPFMLGNAGGQDFIEGIQPLPDFVPGYRKQQPVTSTKDGTDSSDAAPVEPAIISSKAVPLCDYGVHEPGRRPRPNCVPREGSLLTGGCDSHPPSPPGKDGKQEVPENVTDNEYFFNYRNPFSGILPAIDNSTSEEVLNGDKRFRRPFVDANGGGTPLLIDAGEITPELIDQLVDGKVLEISPKKIGDSDAPQEVGPSHKTRDTEISQSSHGEPELLPGHTTGGGVSETVLTDRKIGQPGGHFPVNGAPPDSKVHTNDVSLIKAQGLPKPGASRGVVGFPSGRVGATHNSLNGNAGHFSSTSYNPRIPFGQRLSGLNNPELQVDIPPPRASSPAVQPVPNLRGPFSERGLSGVNAVNRDGSAVRTVSPVGVSHSGIHDRNHGYPGFRGTSKVNIPADIGVTGADNERPKASKRTFNIPGPELVPVSFSFGDTKNERPVQQRGAADREGEHIGTNNTHLQNIRNVHTPQALNHLIIHDQQVPRLPLPDSPKASIGQRPQIRITFLSTRRPDSHPGNQVQTQRGTVTGFVSQHDITRPGISVVNVAGENRPIIAPQEHEHTVALYEERGPLQPNPRTEERTLPVFGTFDAARYVPSSSGSGNPQVDQPDRTFTSTWRDSYDSQAVGNPSEFQGEGRITEPVQPARFPSSLPRGGPLRRGQLAGPAPGVVDTGDFRNIVAAPYRDAAGVAFSLRGAEDDGTFHQQSDIGPGEQSPLLDIQPQLHQGHVGNIAPSLHQELTPATVLEHSFEPHRVVAVGLDDGTRLDDGAARTGGIPTQAPQQLGQVKRPHIQGTHAASQEQQDGKLGFPPYPSGAPNARGTLLTTHRAPVNFDLHSPLNVSQENQPHPDANDGHVLQPAVFDANQGNRQENTIVIGATNGAGSFGSSPDAAGIPHDSVVPDSPQTETADVEQLNSGTRGVIQTASGDGEPRNYDRHLEVPGGRGGHSGDLQHFAGPEALGPKEQGEEAGSSTSSGKTYSFEYHAVGDKGGKTSRREEADGDGRVTGFYTIEDEDGRKRVVHYVADKDGFRAEVRTNEQGTESHRPAHVNVKTENRIPHPPPSVLSPAARATPLSTYPAGLLNSGAEETEAGAEPVTIPTSAP